MDMLTNQIKQTIDQCVLCWLASSSADGFVKTHGLAIAALVCGILGLILSAVPFGILAIIFGAISKRKILEQPNRWDGKGMAQSGLIMGIVSVALTALLIMLGLAIAVL